ncbi:MAG: papain-like cysteine protease family protein [Blastocatellales bacterium]
MFDMQTGPLSDSAFSSFSGVETLDLSAPAPKPMPSLWLDEYDGAGFQSASNGARDRDAWRIDRPGGYLRFKLKLRYQHGLVLICELRGAGSEDQSKSSVMINVNGTEWTTDFESQGADFHRQSWYLLHHLLKQGDNLITLSLPPDASGPVLLKSASIMRFKLQKQMQSNWCWAAVTNSLLGFFNSEISLTQCEIVRKCLNHTGQTSQSSQTTEPNAAVTQKLVPDCCQNGDSEACNIPFKLSQALQEMGILESYEQRALSLDEMRRQISRGVPLAVRIRWRDGNKGGHFVTVTAIGPDNPRGDDFTWIRVADPNDRIASYIPYGTLRNNYKGHGEWTHSYMIKNESPPAKTA